jgi:hypothetical protein
VPLILAEIDRPTAVDERTVFHLDFPSLAIEGRKTSNLSVPLRLVDAIGEYLAGSGVIAPMSSEAQESEGRVAELVGIPARAVLDELVLHLRGRRWVTEWAIRHHGQPLRALKATKSQAPLVLLAGDPGTGKSALMLAAPGALANILSESVMFVQLSERIRGQGIQGRAGSDLVSVLDAIATVAREESVPTLVLLDEADSVASKRGVADTGSGSQENLALVDALIVSLDRVVAKHDTRLAFVMATNLWTRIDPAIMRRASVHVFDRPSQSERTALLELSLGDVLKRHEVEALACELDRDGVQLTGADIISQVIARALGDAVSLDLPLTYERLSYLAKKAVATEPVT